MFRKNVVVAAANTAATLTLGNTIGLPSNPPVLRLSIHITGYRDDGTIDIILIGPPVSKLLLIVKVSHLSASSAMFVTH